MILRVKIKANSGPFGQKKNNRNAFSLPSSEAEQIEISEILPMVLSVGPTAALIFFVPLWGPQLVLAGLTLRSNPNNMTQSRFSISDVMILLALMSVASALTSNLRDEIPFAPFLMLLGAANAFAALMWNKCNRFMSDNGIVVNSHRIVMQLFIYPSSILSIAYVVISSMMLISGLIGAASNYDLAPNGTFLMVVSTMLLCSSAWIYLTRRFYRMLVRPEAETAA